MDARKRTVLLSIASGGLSVAGLIFILISIFGHEDSQWPLIAGLFFVVLGSLFNVINTLLNKKEKDK
ncbi:MAG: hypothetical protein IJH43_02125 [Mogibacterium sp.]|nr:hypothetical protein [Mogibacterium sp.]